MEWTANLLVKHYRLVLIHARYQNSHRIRFRADHLVDPRVFFGRVPSQREAWIAQGGALISWVTGPEPTPHDAIVFVECPRYMWMMWRAMVNTRSVAVIYEPPTWRPHEAEMEKRLEGMSARGQFLRREQHMMMRAFVEQLPVITAQRLETMIRRAQAAASRSSSFPSLSGAGARIPDNRD